MRSDDIRIYLLRKIDILPDEVLTELYRLIQDFLQKPAISKVPVKKEREFGSLKGMVVYMASDFDAPLDDFKGYM